VTGQIRLRITDARSYVPVAGIARRARDSHLSGCCTWSPPAWVT